MIDDPLDITENQVTPQDTMETAFVQSGLHQFNGFSLQSWSPARIMAAQAMGLHYGSVDEAGRERFKSDKVYPGAQRDVAIVLWLCSLKTEQEVDAAAVAPQSAMKRVYEFAEEHKLTDTGDQNFWKGFLVFLTMMEEVAASRVDAEKKTSPDNLAAATT